MKVVVCLSGGIDSTTLLAFYKWHGDEAYPVSFIYPSKHNPAERWAAARVAESLNCNIQFIDATQVFDNMKSNLLNSGGPIPHEHYTHESQSLTVVPGRNTIFSAILLGYAQSIEAEAVAIGIHAGDHAIYPDCRPEFWEAMSKVYLAASEGKVRFEAPFLHLTKVEIVRLGLQIGAPYKFSWTCYEGGDKACMSCGACRERAEAFALNNAPDPACSH